MVKKGGKITLQRKIVPINYNQSGSALEGNKLILSKIGAVSIKIHRQIKGKIKRVIIKRESPGKWFDILESGLGRSFEPVETRPLLSIPALAGQVSSVKQEAPPIGEG